jgi:hypothetical protein
MKRPRKLTTGGVLLCQLLLKVRLDFVVLWKTALLELRVDEVAVEGDFESTTTRWDECKCFDILLEGFQQLFRQTDGFFFVASLRAVFDLQFHGKSPLNER